MKPMEVTATAHPNIALVKYWGKRDAALKLPAMPSLAVTLDGFVTRTTLRWGARKDRVFLDGVEAAPGAAKRVLDLLDRFDPGRPPCEVESRNDFPTAAGLASSSSAFAALALAAATASGRGLSLEALSVLARTGSGSACRSLHGGFTLWRMGVRPDGSDCHAIPVEAHPDLDLRVLVAVVDEGPKALSSTEGMHRTALSSPCYPAFVESGEPLVRCAAEAIGKGDLLGLLTFMERSTRLMLSAMWCSEPAVRYLKPRSLALIDEIEAARGEGLACGWTLDAGPNVKALCDAPSAEALASRIRRHGVRVHVLGVGGPARVEVPLARP
jgi:diphosphomevalonate decarboxylase